MELTEIIQAAILFLGLGVSVLMWVLNDYGKQKHERRNRKEKAYHNLVEGLKGFLASTRKETVLGLRQDFVEECRLIWLFCPDVVVQKANALLRALKLYNDLDIDKRVAAETAVAELMLAIREDLLGKSWLGWQKTKLKAGDFELFGALP